MKLAARRRPAWGDFPLGVAVSVGSFTLTRRDDATFHVEPPEDSTCCEAPEMIHTIADARVWLAGWHRGWGSGYAEGLTTGRQELQHQLRPFLDA